MTAQYARDSEGNLARIIPGIEFKRVAAALRSIDKTMPTKLRKELRIAAKPMVAKGKSAAKAIEVNKADSNNIRRAIARGIRVQAKVTGLNPGVRIVTSMPDKSQAMIPRGFESPAGWRHPVFGGEIVTQHPRNPDGWFLHAMGEGQALALKGMKKILTEARDEIARNGKKI